MEAERRYLNPKRKHPDDDDNIDIKTLRRGCCVKKHTRHITKIYLMGGDIELDIQSRVEISGSENRTPHDIHGYPSLSPFK